MKQKIDPTVSIVLFCVAQVLFVLCGLVPILSLLALPLLILSLIFSCILLHKWWSALPQEFRSTTPATAVGFLFIPFFNLYWVFRAYPGLVSDLNKATGTQGPYGLAVAHAVLLVCSVALGWIPFIGSCIGIAGFVTGLLLMTAVTRQANLLIDAT
jgi:hypothetical protein